MFVRIAFLISLFVVLAVPPVVAETNNAVDLCVQAIEKIRSYDVTFALECLDYPNSADGDNSPSRTGPYHTRDAFASGLGRRVEQFLDTPIHSISVMDWQTANSDPDKRPASTAISYALDGNGYLDFVNPNCWGFFLVDLLRDKQSRIQRLDPPSNAKHLIGFEVTHPQMMMPVRVWADPPHGYMPAIIEKYVLDNSKKRRLFGIARVQEFRDVGGGVWVPVKCTHALMSGVKLKSGKPYAGTSLTIDVKKYSWNSITSGDLFDANNIHMNHVRNDGYKQSLSAVALEMAKQTDKIAEDIKSASPPPRKKAK